MARCRVRGENECQEEGVEREVEVPNPEDNVMDAPIPSNPPQMVKQTSTSEYTTHDQHPRQGHKIGSSIVPSTQPINPWGG